MGYRVAKSRCGILLLTLLLSACASQVPQNIRKAPADNLSLEQVREHTADYLGRQVRWGGTIIETGNREATTLLTVLGRPLYKGGEPKFTDVSAGRFIAIVPAFLDPQVYASDRQVTFTGSLLRTETGKVGEYPYTYPVIQADAWYLWPEATERPRGYPPPWYPYGYPYPYRYPHRYRR
jgi:outer membrane lipoprotein